jgi:hypothetical protein
MRILGQIYLIKAEFSLDLEHRFSIKKMINLIPNEKFIVLPTNQKYIDKYKIIKRTASRCCKRRKMSELFFSRNNWKQQAVVNRSNARLVKLARSNLREGQPVRGLFHTKRATLISVS